MPASPSVVPIPERPSGDRPGARAVALDLLGQVLDRRRPFDDLLDGHKALAALEPRDRAFTHLMVATVLRRLGQLDALIAHCVPRPLPSKASSTRNLLRLGIAQLLFLAVPAHAAVGETVALAETVDWGGFKGLANAVLRRLAQEGAALVAAQDAPRLNTPDWLWSSWCRAYGEAAARGIAEAHLGEPPLDITVKGDAAPWAERLDARLLPTGSLRRAGTGDVRALPGFDEGAWWVQDAAAALPARLLGDVAGRSVIDLCAAPGGKTAQLAAAGAIVTAVDRSASRFKRVRQNLARLGLGARLFAADVALWRPESRADAVLLDAPCTATGTIRRHPDVARLKTPEDVGRMAAEQDRLLQAAVGMVRPGGTLVYTTCSLQPEEGPARVAALLDAGAPLRRRPVDPAELGGLAELVTAEGDLRTLPCQLTEHGGLDGFYAARLERL
jgi:16S rRNA (cytosine967-C5)-methyltransferase